MTHNPFPFAVVPILLVARCTSAQGSFVYDQQSSTNPASAGGGPIIQQIAPPYGQSFTPTLSSVAFLQLGLFDSNPGNGFGATVHVNLRTGSIGGPTLASTDPVFMPDGFGDVAPGVTNFFFSGNVTLTPGTTYYFQPVVESGDLWGISAGPYNYPGGSVFVGGQPASASDYWFREGIFVPEPPSALLFLAGAGVLVYVRHRYIKWPSPARRPRRSNVASSRH